MNLRKFNLQSISYPFDYLLISDLQRPNNYIKGLKYIIKSIETNFKYNLSDLKYNNSNKPYSTYYKDVLFYHHDLIEDSYIFDSFKRRFDRFKNSINEEKVYIFNIHYDCYIENQNTINRDLSLLKSKLHNNSKILVLLTSWNNFELSQNYNFENIYFYKFYIDKKQNYISGDELKFLNILLNHL